MICCICWNGGLIIPIYNSPLPSWQISFHLIRWLSCQLGLNTGWREKKQMNRCQNHLCCVCMCVCSCLRVCVCVCVREREREKEKEREREMITYLSSPHFFCSSLTAKKTNKISQSLCLTVRQIERKTHNKASCSCCALVLKQHLLCINPSRGNRIEKHVINIRR